MNFYPPVETNPMKIASQIAQFNQINFQQPNQMNPLEDVRNKLANLTGHQFEALRGTNEFSTAFSMYQQGLQEYVMNKFAYEYASTEKGRQELQIVNQQIDVNLEAIKRKSKDEQDRLERLSKILDSNPDILNKLESAINGEDNQ